MKIVTSRQMSDIETAAYRNGASQTDFMEEAGSGVALVVQDYVEKHDCDRIAILLCGKGNNAGDAYVAGIHLLSMEYEVIAIQVIAIEECSPLCKQNYERFVHSGGEIANKASDLPNRGIIVDGLFGTGFHGSPTQDFIDIIEYANFSGLPIIAIDIPSGLNGDSGEVTNIAIVATETAFLGLPKLGFFLEDGWDYVGKLRYVDFGLPEEYIQDCESELIALTSDMIQQEMPAIKRNRHKYEAGYVVGIAGSIGMPGAAILSATSALHGGAGIVRLMYPDGMQAELAASPPELIRTPFHFNDFEPLIAQMNRATATFIGPGIGVNDDTRHLLQNILPCLNKPCVIDADALNILAEGWISVPEHTILTPHLKEMMRLLKMTETPTLDLAFLNRCRQFAHEKKITLVLKGAVTFIIHQDAPFMINFSGDPGMATAGSGDLLTGLIAALLAQKKTPDKAATMGAFLHGLAGEHAAEEMTSYAMIASDILYHFPESFKFQVV